MTYGQRPSDGDTESTTYGESKWWDTGTSLSGPARDAIILNVRQAEAGRDPASLTATVGLSHFQLGWHLRWEKLRRAGPDG
jgi:hypothetical protein